MAMRSMRRFYSEIKGKKVNELPAYIKSTYSMESVKTYTSSLNPLLHICFGGMAFSYLLCYPPREMSSMLRNLFRSLEMIFRYSKVRSFLLFSVEISFYTSLGGLTFSRFLT
ncbi:hypothetical protein Bca52824_089248 [Brassica carinata]|uniref:Uncharacterized protein n=1 Tax=Brassica carinata TaxID=52824 RepID=A0A8X7NZK3_BRACI|nr:hypothetical protein Bca52824_096402 [Brassica carinata]KAG2249620.1 hypothetical protein Bca52824_089248 [Brassica carinata]